MGLKDGRAFQCDSKRWLIQTTFLNHLDYYNRIDRYFFLIQAIMDHISINVNVGWPGSVHDGICEFYVM